MAVYGVRAVVDAISRKAYEANGCPECGRKRCYEIVHTPDMALMKCPNTECYVVFPVILDDPEVSDGA